MSTLNLNQCDNDCLECIKRYKNKHTLERGQTFDIKCKGIDSPEVQDCLLKGLPPQDQKTAKAMLDPVTWAAQALDWHCIDPDGEIWKRKNPEEFYQWQQDNPGVSILGKSRYHRPYQAEMLRCLHPETKVFMADGTVKDIQDIEVGETVVTYNENKKTTQTSYKVLNKWQNGIKNIYEITLANGDKLKVTSNHPILSWTREGKLNKLLNLKSFKRSYRSIDDGLSIGDKVYTLNKFGVFGGVEDIDMAKLLGYIVTDGYVSNTGITGKKHIVEFRNIRKEYVEEFRELIIKVFGLSSYSEPDIQYHPPKTDKNGVHHKEHWSYAVHGRYHELLRFLRDIGCTDKTNREESITKYAFEFAEKALYSFINRCWAGDGCIYNQDDPNLKYKKTYLSLSSGNNDFLELFRLLLKKIGINTSHIYTDKKESGTSLSLSISRIEDIETFFDHMGPVFGKEPQSRIAIHETAKRNHNRRHGSLKTLSRTKIVDIRYIGQETVYDIEVDTRHNFIANGLVVHNCTSRRKVFRIGRQAGKCLPSGTLIQMADGTQKPVELIEDGDMVVSVDDNYQATINPAYRACNGVKPSFRITLMDGREIEATGNHPFLSRKNVGRETTGNRRAVFHDEWIETEDLTEQDYLAVPRSIELDRQEGIGDHYMSILGCMIADGNMTGGNCRFSNENPVILDKLRESLNYLGCSLKQYECDESEVDYHIVGHGTGKRHPVKDWFRQLGLQGLNSHEKFIPDFFMTLCDENIVEMLRAMFGCDGWACVDKYNSPQIGYSTVSEKLASQVISLLSRFGIYADVRVKTVKLNDKKYLSRQICITRKQDIANFRNKIGILGKDEQVELTYQASQKKNSSPKTEAYEDNDIVFIKVKSVEPIGDKMTWDLTVPETHNFIANNIVTHNTECLVVSMLFHLFVKPGIPETEGFEIIVITPYQSQIDLIFKRLMQLIRTSPITQNSLRRHVKAPIYQIELNNESTIKGFTAGTKSGGNADAVRGQHAHMLVFDEADYLSAGDMDSALSIITNYPTASVWMSSTPSGKREKFYQTSYLRDWKEFYYSSQVNPMWNDDLEVLFRSQLTEIGYKHEILAEFGEQEEGVFQNTYVQAAMDKSYTYGQFPFERSWTYTIGVDWNDIKNGTTIVVLGLDPVRNKFFVVDRQIVQREGWTQLTACQKIADLNRAWHPIAIYIDEGYGATQWEILRKYGHDAAIDPTRGPAHADAKLRQIVKKYNFSSSIETRDLWTHQPVKKDAKPFLVESTVRRFEASDIRFPKNDELLEKQLLGYIIDRVTPTGKPVYKANDETAGDHILDALMLSVIAFTMEVTPLGKPRYQSDISFSGNFGERIIPDIHEGDLVVQNPFHKERVLDERADKRPEMNRTSVLENKSLFPSGRELPANHVNIPQVKTWSWSGFLRDEPQPRVRGLSEAESDAKRRLGIRPRSISKPRRKNI